MDLHIPQADLVPPWISLDRLCPAIWTNKRNYIHDDNDDHDDHGQPCVLSTLRHYMLSAVHDILHAMMFIVQIYARYTTIRALRGSACFQTDLATI